jgi:hypothetical protein
VPTDTRIINPATKDANLVMPDLIRHPVMPWIPAFAGMTLLVYLIAGLISKEMLSRESAIRK